MAGSDTEAWQRDTILVINRLLIWQWGENQMSADNANGPAKGLVPVNEDENPSEAIQSGRHAEQNWQGTVLDTRDPIEAAIADLVQVYRYRRPALLIDGDPFATFAISARNMDIPAFGVPEAILHMIQKEQANINAMRRSNTLFDPQNADALGSYMELAFYANVLYAWIKRYMQGFR